MFSSCVNFLLFLNNQNCCDCLQIVSRILFLMAHSRRELKIVMKTDNNHILKDKHQRGQTLNQTKEFRLAF